jgi:hypothetical protein
VCCLLFIAAPPGWKPYVPLLVLPPQIVWLWFVRARARVVGVGRW